MRFRLHPAATALLLAGLVGACADAPAGPEGEAPYGHVRGQIVAPGVTDVEGVSARVSWPGLDVQADVFPDGTFEVPIPREVTGWGSLTIDPGPDASLHPAWVPITSADIDGPAGTIVLAPRSWTVQAGVHAGTTVPIDPDLAADARVMPSYWGFYFPFSQDGFEQTVTNGRQWAGEIRTWAPSAFPLALVFDGEGAEWTAADSIALWAHVERMESALGFDAFRPASFDEVHSEDGTPDAGVVTVRIDRSLGAGGVGVIDPPDAPTYSISTDADGWSGSDVNDVRVVSADIRHGVVRLGSTTLVRDGRLVVHELMHVLGAGHGCGWASVQTYCTPLATTEPSAPDVAHLAVLSAMRRLEGEHRTRWGVVAAVFGHRVVTLGLPPVPEAR